MLISKINEHLKLNKSLKETLVPFRVHLNTIMANHNFIILFECKMRAIPCHALTITKIYALILTDIII